MIRQTNRRPVLGVALLVVVALTAAACAKKATTSSSGTSPAPAASVGPFGAREDPAVAKEVPAAIRAKHTIIVAVDASYAPNEFFASNNKTIIGWDVDLGNALAAVMGLKFDWVNTTFDGIIPGLKSGKFGLGISSFTDTLARQKVVDFVTYYQAGTSFVVKASGGPNITRLSQLCGMTVAVETGTTEQADATAQSKRCKAEGRAPVTVLAYPTQNGANLALVNGRAQVMMADSPVAAYQVKLLHGQVKLGGEYGVAPYGFAIPKGSGMAKPLLDAMRVLISDGIYLKILTKWGVQTGAITNPAINAAKS